MFLECSGPKKIFFFFVMRPTLKKTLYMIWIFFSSPKCILQAEDFSKLFDRMPSPTWVFAVRTDHFVGFVLLQLFLIFWKSLTSFLPTD